MTDLDYYDDEWPDVDSIDRCRDCGHDGDEHDAPAFGGGCHVCGDCPGWLA